MKTTLFSALALVCIMVSANLVAQDVEGSKDPSLFSRMPGWRISQYEENQFGSYEFSGTKGEKVTVEGSKLIVSYAWAGSGKKPSSLQVIRNYQNAIKKIGGSVVLQKGDDFCTLKVVKDGKESWVEVASEVDAGWGGFIVTVIDKQAMTQDVAANADALKEDIKASGHASVYGITFEADKAEIRPEADAALSEIAKLLTRDAGLKLLVVGHTANVGDRDAGVKLSQARAEAVVNRLADKYGIQASRLVSYGVGPYCPVSTNQTEEGRAKNRRVELVQQ
ncbi:MAG TPA: OmpA family protein [Spirochaetia bacterium]|nr:OmpA family protein [Spirochaetia bacterium]